MMKHVNNGRCPKCHEIIHRYSGFHEELLAWFMDLQERHPEAHVSCAGRGEIEQEGHYQVGRSKAHFGESAHNYNCALDLFEMWGNPKHIYENEWFQAVIRPEIEKHQWLNWYGSKDAKFKELPHVEVRNWRELRDQGLIHLVEDYDDAA